MESKQSHPSARNKEVKEYFENADVYLGKDGRSLGILSRQRIVQAFLGNERFENALDAPCGNGLVSIPIAKLCENLLLVDIAESMTERTKKNVELAALDNAKVENLNIVNLDPNTNQFDLALCIGILAHVPSPLEFLEHINRLLMPGGSLILQNTDDSHLKIRAQKALSGNKTMVQKNSYSLNPISHKWIMSTLKGLGYSLKYQYRYETRIPGLLEGRNDEAGLNQIWKIFGKPPNNKLGFLGSKCMYRFIKES